MSNSIIYDSDYISVLELPIRVEFALRRNGYPQIRDLIHSNESQLRECFNIGDISIKQITTALEKYNYKLLK